MSLKTIQLLQGDCLERMAEIPAGSVDLIAADLPYGITACKWDSVIPFRPLWKEYRRLLKPLGVVVLTASQPFATDLINSNREWFKYEIIWLKNRMSDKFNVKNKPMNAHENILVFSPGTTANCSSSKMPYFPQGLRRNTTKTRGTTGKRHYRECPSHKKEYVAEWTGYPNSVVFFRTVGNAAVHATQKPVALFQYLIRTYSNLGETVLDNTMGSGTTGVAALNTGRKFVGIEKDPEIFATAEKRINARARIVASQLIPPS